MAATKAGTLVPMQESLLRPEDIYRAGVCHGIALLEEALLRSGIANPTLAATADFLVANYNHKESSLDIEAHTAYINEHYERLSKGPRR
jgi:hypothetical protein